MGAPRWKLVAPVAVGLVTVSVAAGVLVTAVSPASATGGLCASYPGSGSGTAVDPYLVSTPAELAALDACASAGQTTGAYFKQTAAISLAGYPNWNPIGTGNSAGTRFGGIYDGPGACSGALPVPVGAQSGQQTLQVNGYASSGSVRSLSLGIQVTPARVAMTCQAQVSVFFAPL